MMTCSRPRPRAPGRCLIPVVVLFAIAGGLAPGAARSVEVRPAGVSATVLTVGGKDRTFFRITPKQELRVAVTGPGRLKIISRLAFPADLGGVQQYSLVITENGKPVLSRATSTTRSSVTVKGAGLAAGKSRRLTLDVPAGSHIYHVALGPGAAPGALLRFRFTPAGDTTKRASLSPLSYSRIATAVVREKLITYFVATPTFDVKVRVIGPTRLRITARLNYDARMTGEQKYAILVRENGNVIRTRSLVATKSAAVVYRDWPEVVPGKGQTFSLDVPRGEHTYRCGLESTIGRSVSLRFSIPGKDIANGG